MEQWLTSYLIVCQWCLTKKLAVMQANQTKYEHFILRNLQTCLRTEQRTHLERKMLKPLHLVCLCLQTIPEVWMWRQIWRNMLPFLTLKKKHSEFLQATSDFPPNVQDSSIFSHDQCFSTVNSIFNFFSVNWQACSFNCASH
jgi:hypothetical protein